MKKYIYIQILLLLVLFQNSMAENGITDDEILLGQSCALTGPAEELGKGMKAGLMAYFNQINEKGGIYGRKIKLISLDDGYEPDRAIQNTRQLIDEYKVFLLIGEVGTPTSQAVVPIAEERSIPFVGPFTGAEFLRNPFKKYVINVRASYFQEMEKLAQYLVDQKGLKKIACFYQNDGYGLAGFKGIELALQKRGLELVSTGTYERNTIAVKTGLLKIRNNQPQAVVMVGAYKPCAKFIKLTKKINMHDVIFCNISFVGSDALLKELGSDGEGCIISQVVPHPQKTTSQLVQDYIEDMKKQQSEDEINFVSLEGYIVAKLFCLTAEKNGKEITRESFLSTITNTGEFNLEGQKLKYGPSDNQGMDKVYLTIIKNETIVPIED